MKYIPKSLMLLATIALAGCSNEPSTPEGLFKSKCAMCHSLKPDVHRIGPSLYGVWGRKAGSTSYTKYKALKNAEFIWDEKALNAWITNPKEYIKKPTAMTVKIKKEEDRKMILGYLKSGQIPTD